MEITIPTNSNTDPFARLQEIYGHKLSDADKVQIATNLKGFFGILQEWAQQDAYTEGKAENAK